MPDSLSLPEEQLAAIKTAVNAAEDKNFAVFIAEPLLPRYYKSSYRQKTANIEHAQQQRFRILANMRSDGQLAARLHPCGLVRRFDGRAFSEVGLDEYQQGIKVTLDFALSFRQLNYLVAV